MNRPSRFALASALIGGLWGARQLLPAVNWIGPTAAFVFRTGPRFDPAFVQLADVEFYGRALKTGPLARLSGISVGSLGHHAGQITARIDPVALARKELAPARRPDAARYRPRRPRPLPGCPDPQVAWRLTPARRV